MVGSNKWEKNSSSVMDSPFKGGNITFILYCEIGVTISEKDSDCLLVDQLQDFVQPWASILIILNFTLPCLGPSSR